MKKDKNLSYMDTVHRDGTIWNLSIMVLLLLFPVAVWIIFEDATPSWSQVLKGLGAVAPMYWAVGVVEVITFIPMLGAGGSYLSFVTGNISNLKLPCAINALENAEADPKTEEGEIISTIAIAVSSIVTTVIVAVGVALIVPLNPIISSPVLTPAFEQLLPALFGALGVALISKSWKIAVAPILLRLILFIFVPSLNEGSVGIMVPVGVVFTIFTARIMYKKNML